jgi:MFS family permease
VVYCSLPAFLSAAENALRWGLLGQSVPHSLQESRAPAMPRGALLPVFYRYLKPLTATQARQRMAVVAVSSAFFNLTAAGAEVFLPLWVTRDLGFTASQWAQLRSLRMIGVLVGVILLGALADRLGQRLIGVATMLGGALVLFALSLGYPGSIWIGMPLFGAAISTTLVNLNTLTQQISVRRQGVANTVYRSVGAATSILAPVLVTGLAAIWHGYPLVLRASALVLVVGALMLAVYPGEPLPPPLNKLTDELHSLWRGYRHVLAQRRLMSFMHVSLLWNNILAGVGTFAAIRFTQQLGQTDQEFGTLSAIAGAASLLVTAGSGFFLDRVSLRKLHGVGAILASLCSLLLGSSDVLLLSATALVIYRLLIYMLVGPTSMWVSRVAGSGTQSAAFSMQKVLGAIYVAITTAILGVLESWIGMRGIFFYGGLLGLIVSLAFFALQEPPASHREA